MKVLILTRSTGEGHNHAARALRQSFVARGHECQVMDALAIAQDGGAVPELPRVTAMGSLSAAPRHHSDVASRLYNWVAYKAPHAFGVVYGIGEAYSNARIPSPIRFHNARFAEATHRHIEERGYDVVIAVHMFPEATLSAVRRRHPSNIKYYCVLTDYSCTPFFAEAKLDGYFIPHPDMVAAAERQGCPADRLHVTGLPVSAAFEHLPSRADARSDLGLPPQLPVFLVMSGGVGGQFVMSACDRLLSGGGEDVRVVVLTGRREDTYTAIKKRYEYDPRLMAVPFTDRVPEFMAAADVMLTKPGAVTSTEAAVAHVPMIHTGAIPGLETKNARFFADRGMSLYAQQGVDAADLAQGLLLDPTAVDRMRANQARGIIPDGAARIVDVIESEQM